MLPDALAAAIDAEADAAAAAVRARRHVDVLLAARECASVAAEEPALLTPTQLAKRLGVSVAHIRRLDPPAVVLGDATTRRFDIDAVRAWLLAREPKATTPPKRDSDVDVSGSLSRAGLRRAS